MPHTESSYTNQQKEDMLVLYFELNESEVFCQNEDEDNISITVHARLLPARIVVLRCIAMAAIQDH